MSLFFHGQRRYGGWKVSLLLLWLSVLLLTSCTSASSPSHKTSIPRSTRGASFASPHIDAITRFALPDAYSGPLANELTRMTIGPDGALWFTERDKIGRITAPGKVTEFTVPIPDSYYSSDIQPLGITTGPDGALWFADFVPLDGQIGRITTQDQITTFALPAGCDPDALTGGPDGALWFIDNNSNKIGRITTQGKVTEFALPAESFPAGLTAGPDGALWFTEDEKIGRITTQGKVTEFATSDIIDPEAITAGPDGALWFLDSTGIGRITVQGQISHFDLKLPASYGLGTPDITTGPDGALWVTEYGKIGRLTIQS